MGTLVIHPPQSLSKLSLCTVFHSLSRPKEQAATRAEDASRTQATLPQAHHPRPHPLPFVVDSFRIHLGLQEQAIFLTRTILCVQLYQVEVTKLSAFMAKNNSNDSYQNLYSTIEFSKHIHI